MNLCFFTVIDSVTEFDAFDNWMLHHDNTPSHSALIVSELLTKMGVWQSYPSRRKVSIFPHSQGLKKL